MAAPAGAAEPPIVMQQFHMNVDVHADGTYVETRHIEIAVANDAAARNAAQQSGFFSDAIETLTVEDAYTLKPDGTRVPVQPQGIRIELAPGLTGTPAYTDRKRLTIVFPDVQARDVLVMNWRRELKQPFVAGYSSVDAFPRVRAWRDVDVRFTTPPAMTLQTEADGPSLELSTEPDGRHVYRFRYQADAVAEDPAVVSVFDRSPRLIVSTFPDWPSLSRSYAATVAAPARVTPVIQALADHVTEGVTDKREQAKRLYEWVGHNVRWVMIWLGNDGFIPHDADDVLARRYGDCKDQATLLVALMHAKGIAAEPVLINYSPHYRLGTPANYWFDHMITYLPDWKIYADTTASVAPFGTVPLVENGKPALRIDPLGASPEPIPQLAPGVARSEFRTAESLDADGVVSGTSTTTGYGPFATVVRSAGRRAEALGSETAAGQLLTRQREAGQGSFVLTTALDSDDNPPVETLAASFTLEPNRGWLDGDPFRIPSGLRVTAEPGETLLGPLDNRRLPASEPTPCFAGEQSEELSLALPPGYAPESLPKDAKVEGSFFAYTSHWHAGPGEVGVTRHFVSTLMQPLCEGPAREEAAHALPAMRRDLRAQITLHHAE